MSVPRGALLPEVVCGGLLRRGRLTGLSNASAEAKLHPWISLNTQLSLKYKPLRRR
jgi:hypothetical protein